MTRDEFEALLKKIYNSQVFEERFETLLSLFRNDKETMDQVLIRYLRAQGRIQFYLTEWDNAPNQAAKDAIVGSVDGQLGNANVNPDDARMWPPLGIWGNVYQS